MASEISQNFVNRLKTGHRAGLVSCLAGVRLAPQQGEHGIHFFHFHETEFAIRIDQGDVIHPAERGCFGRASRALTLRAAAARLANRPYSRFRSRVVRTVVARQRFRAGLTLSRHWNGSTSCAPCGARAGACLKHPFVWHGPLLLHPCGRGSVTLRMQGGTAVLVIINQRLAHLHFHKAD